MSKAFTREDDDAPEIALVRPRPALPEGAPNYVTPRGAVLLREEHAKLLGLLEAATGEVRQAALARLAGLVERLALTEIVEPAASPTVARLGNEVRFHGDLKGTRTARIVGVDEAAAEAGAVAWTSPLGRALTGKSEGESFTLRTPAGEEEITVLEVL